MGGGGSVARSYNRTFTRQMNNRNRKLDRLSLDPPLTSPKVQQASSRPKSFESTGWASVSLPAETGGGEDREAWAGRRRDEDGGGGEGECRRRGEDGGKGLEVEKGWCQCSSVEAKTSFVDIVVEEVGARGEGNACRGGLNPLGGAAKRVLGVPRFYLG